MVTQCTACQVWFKVTRDQLHSAHGLVRCSACDTVFNALATLRHGRPEAVAGSEGVPMPADNVMTETPPAALETTSPPTVDTETTGDDARESSWLQPIPDEELPVTDVPHECRSGFDSFETSDKTTDNEAVEESATPPAVSDAEVSADEEIPLSFQSRASSSSHGRFTYRWPWIAALAVALLVLVGQLVYAQRASIAGLFGVRHAIALERYTITDAALDGAPRQPGILVLSGKLLNRADHAQPLPLLRVTLTDRYGGTVGTRTLTPREYGARANSALKAHRRLMFHVKLADPGASAVGFSLILCKHRDHSVWCQG